MVTEGATVAVKVTVMFFNLVIPSTREVFSHCSAPIPHALPNTVRYGYGAFLV